MSRNDAMILITRWRWKIIHDVNTPKEAKNCILKMCQTVEDFHNKKVNRVV